MDVPLVEPAITAASTPSGLSSAEAARRLLNFGPNRVVEERVQPLARVMAHFWAPVPWMLEATIALQVTIGERLEALMIATLLLLNVGLGVFQENRANAALALLKQRLVLKVRVKRDGAWVEAPAADLVPGDIVQASLGSVVPADLRIIAGTVLLDQSMLTGESIPAEAEPGKIAFAGALVRRGEATAEVVATGARTYFGRAAELVRIAHVESSEQQAVLGVVRNLTIVNFAIVIGMVAYAHAIGMSTTRIIPLVLTALLSAVPVALPATFTLAATLGAKALALKGVLLTRLSALHEAAMIDVLCADKTGTLTANELIVSAVLPVKEGWSEEDVLAVAALASSTDGQDPIDAAIRSTAQRQNASHRRLEVLRFTPFDPAVKMAEAVAINGDGGKIHVIKGAPAVVGTIAPMNPETAAKVQVLSAAGSPDPWGGVRTAGQPRFHRADRVWRSSPGRLAGPACRVGSLGRAHCDGHRRCRGYRRDGRPGGRAGRSRLPGENPRDRRPRRIRGICRGLSGREVSARQGISAMRPRRRHVR
jgi:H+-transporting ATPase